ncbi:helicase [Fibrisoma montanum]|uniref:Helicase n=1 Tax=Fibrisoma montanum TaxID=2305895 RepID=A0A418MFB1_9BACT|nr:helicase-related protein [Fibrisoma montanum]RIV25466.1 helicase [Fibrisoma montanum]
METPNDLLDPARSTFVSRLQRSLIGPGSDRFGLPDKQEIIADFPLNRYYSAVLFPEKQTQTIGDEDDSAALSDLTDDGLGDTFFSPTNQPVTDEEAAAHAGQPNAEEPEVRPDETLAANHFFPNNMGLTCCLDPAVTGLSVEVSFALYRPLKTQTARIAISADAFEALAYNSVYPLDTMLAYQDGFMELVGAGKSLKAGDLWSYFREYPGIHQSEGYEKLLLLLGRAIWQREGFSKQLPITIPKPGSYEEHPLHRETFGKKTCSLVLFVQSYQQGKVRYVKLLLANRSTPHPATRFSNGNEVLNRISIFQPVIRVVDVPLQPFQTFQSINPFDEEENLINYQYRKERAFGQGHGCAVDWGSEQQPTTLQTTYLPQADIKHYSNQLRDNIPETVQSVIQVRNLSIWTEYDKEDVLNRLGEFIDCYEQWHKTEQDAEARQEPQHSSCYEPLLKGQRETVERLKRNLERLKDDEVYRCFQLANTAMYIQMIISRDRDKAFGATPKPLAKFAELIDTEYDSLQFFRDYDRFDDKHKAPAYRPFQLAFLLLNIIDTLESTPSPDNWRNLVDLIWFPTGGGKTEAYLALTAFTIVARRVQHPDPKAYEGVSVLMRYTLRLLTAQQFERASRLIVALEFMRRHLVKEGDKSLGELPISIGMWVGAASTPNKYTDAQKGFSDLTEAIAKANQSKQAVDPTQRNPFPVQSCPWCGCDTVTKTPSNQQWAAGYKALNNLFQTFCRNSRCAFRQEIPVYFVDEQVYEKRPTLLFATVDKFAQLPHVKDGYKLFNAETGPSLPPDLIIQDELHLLSGPLGSLVGLFESVVDMLCSKNGRVPKIVASTATTRNTAQQIRMLYDREVNIFPAPGITYDDNFFSYVQKTSLRRHIGFMPTGKTGLNTQVKLLAHLLLARAELLMDLKREHPDPEAQRLIDPYWTVVSYYNSLKDVGKAYNQVGSEIHDALRQLHFRYGLHPYYRFNFYGLSQRTKELTSRVPSQEIKPLLSKLETPFQLQAEEDRNYVIDTVDLVLASNMLSVGIDVSRLNLMLMNGLPRNVAEYIQASSRVGREHKGLVVNLLDPNRSREKSFFEHYQDFNSAYYKFVEPLSVTPYTRIAVDKAMNSLLVTFVRHLDNKYPNNGASQFIGDVDRFRAMLTERIPEADDRAYALDKLDKLVESWSAKRQSQPDLVYKDNKSPKSGLIQPAGRFNEWSLMQSMREVDTTSGIRITNQPSPVASEPGEEQPEPIQSTAL